MNVDDLMFLLCQIQNKYTRGSFRVCLRANCIYRGKTCVNFCVPAQCMAALKDYEQRAEK